MCSSLTTKTPERCLHDQTYIKNLAAFSSIFLRCALPFRRRTEVFFVIFEHILDSIQCDNLVLSFITLNMYLLTRSVDFGYRRQIYIRQESNLPVLVFWYNHHHFPHPVLLVSVENDAGRLDWVRHYPICRSDRCDLN